MHDTYDWMWEANRKQILPEEKMIGVAGKKGIVPFVPGIFRFKDNNIQSGSYREIAVNIHDTEEYRTDRIDESPGYTEGITEYLALAHKKGVPVVAAVSGIFKKPLESALQIIVDSGTTSNTFIYFTEMGSPEPRLQSWEELFENIGLAFNPERINVVGAEVLYNPKGKLSKGGCVNLFTKESQKRFRTKMDLRYCWVNPDTGNDIFFR